MKILLEKKTLCHLPFDVGDHLISNEDSIQDLSSFDEGILITPNDFRQYNFQSISEHLGDYLVQATKWKRGLLKQMKKKAIAYENQDLNMKV
ncbi:hypothetical protein DKX38_016766 [Salix brachista]|uniref:Uncharacterized protein n=1 Tax=Salix brachista TaxID=2182728 RepID=A0A5N5KTI4_9ROSI|nr:hypothetical protein DKX38_016766 [Salix brachista]